MVCASKFTAAKIRGTTGELSKLVDFQGSVFNIIYIGTLHSIALQFFSILSDRFCSFISVPWAFPSFETNL